ncbi:unnamed protein product [Pleuronectes platessa]|uniref:Uncharacterized protein n=1 Tax=Pleuronectes platessa TaxID=8262 RepID=A0A9N7VUL8_PLEPL|nr:unnamed protein product [Pleuronectes platessa]
MQWFFVQKPTAAAYRRLHASAAACLSAAAAPLPAPRGRRRHLKRSTRGVLAPRRPGGSSSSSDRSSAAEKHRPLGQPEAATSETSAAAVALFLPHGDDVDAEYVQLLVSGLAEEPGEKPGDEPGSLLLFWSMVQIGGPKHRRTEPNSWPALLACKQGGVLAPMRWVNLRLPHPERLSSPTSSSSTTSSSSPPVSAKSMRFIWNNIFSKGSHMLQCLCGRSLKKTKNPTENTNSSSCTDNIRGMWVQMCQQSGLGHPSVSCPCRLFITRNLLVPDQQVKEEGTTMTLCH